MRLSCSKSVNRGLVTSNELHEIKCFRLNSNYYNYFNELVICFREYVNRNRYTLYFCNTHEKFNHHCIVNLPVVKLYLYLFRLSNLNKLSLIKRILIYVFLATLSYLKHFAVLCKVSHVFFSNFIWHL